MSPDDVNISVLANTPEKGYYKVTVKYEGPLLSVLGNGVARSRDKAVAFAFSNLSENIKKFGGQDEQAS